MTLHLDHVRSPETPSPTAPQPPKQSAHRTLPWVVTILGAAGVATLMVALLVAVFDTSEHAPAPIPTPTAVSAVEGTHPLPTMSADAYDRLLTPQSSPAGQLGWPWAAEVYDQPPPAAVEGTHPLPTMSADAYDRLLTPQSSRTGAAAASSYH